MVYAKVSKKVQGIGSEDSAGAGVGEGNRCTGGEEEMHSVE